MSEFKYPFTAMVGQERVKRGLILNIIAPEIGGMVLSGKNGATKIDVIRSLYSLMEEVEVHTISLYVTEDRLQGYSEMGDTILVGRIDSKEDISEPQFLDRFGFYVEIEEEGSIEEKMESVSRKFEYEENPEAFREKYLEAEKRLYMKILSASKKYKKIAVPYSVWLMIMKLSREESVQGFRRDFVLLVGARANAAFEGRSKVTEEDVKVVAELALFHRFGDDFDSVKNDMDLIYAIRQKKLCL